MLFQLTNFGQPIIDVVDSNHENRRELYLMRRHEGIDLETNLEGNGRVLFSHGHDGGQQQKSSDC